MIPREHRAVVVVPARAERPGFWSGLDQVCRAAEALAIVVVNGRVDDDPQTRACNDALWHGLRALGANREVDEDTVYVELGGAGLLLIDRFTRGGALGADEGVGTARKIGADLALALIAAGCVHTRWIRFTDADVELPSAYFAGDAKNDADARVTALTYPFWHGEGEDAEITLATAWYEVWLRHYVVGLGRAGSPYAYHTIGSCMAADAVAYAQVHGVPKRQAGEDFYLLTKLAKQGHVVRVDSEPVGIRARASERVPFGTGPAIVRIAAARREGKPLMLHDPRVFDALHAALGWLRRSSTEGRLVEAQGDAEAMAARLLAQQGAGEGLLRGWRGARHPRERWRRAMQWFDGLRTLRFVHACRDAALPDVPWWDALTALDVDHASVSDIDALRRSLLAIEPERAGLSPRFDRSQ